MPTGIIYVLTNEAMPGLVKIGHTQSDLATRMRQLDTSGVPLPFECFFALRVENAARRERLLHDAFDGHRVRPRREFFEVSPEAVASALRMADGEDVTPRDSVVDDAEDRAALERAHRRRANFNFGLADVPMGSVLTHVRNENASCTVVDRRNVEFRGEIMSLSAAALVALNEIGYTWRAVQGPAYWEFDGQPLDERRRRIEESE